MSKARSIKDLDLKGKKALIRVDFNVPLKNGTITDDSRIRATLPTINYVLSRGGSVILMSHLGRPQSKPDPQLSLAPCAQRLSELLNKPVKMAPDSVGTAVDALANDLQPGQILLLENLRFHKGEEKPKEEPDFASRLAQLGDVYIDDAFGCAHRPHASITEICKFFPDKSAAGFLIEKEIAFLGESLLNPQHPFCTILGGAKISTKFNIIEKLIQKSDALLVGGAMAFTFFKAQGIAIGNSLFEPEFLEKANELLKNASSGKCKILLPVDVVVAKKIDSDAGSMTIDVSHGIPNGYEGVDIGPKTVALFSKEMKQAKTVFWNGPMGVFEYPPFAKGTQAVAAVLAKLEATTIIGGGDSVAAISEAGVSDRITHISTGGGACLEYIEQGSLPGIDALALKKTSLVS